MLWLRGYPTHRYLTFKHALESGGHVRKGEHGTQNSSGGRITKRGNRYMRQNLRKLAKLVPTVSFDPTLA